MVNVVFLHPDLGIGGAERAVIDAALALQSRNHQASLKVEFVTAHHDDNHCFKETTDGSLKVTVAGDWLPRSVCGRMYALCAYLRMVYAALYLVFFSGISFDLVFCDQISACIPVLRLQRKASVLFYCHFPDLLLTQRQTLLKRLYRKPLDWLEEWTTGLAHCVLVNSKFTAGVFHRTFTSLGYMEPDVLYPIPDFTQFDGEVIAPTDDLIPAKDAIVFLSINRYERKKNLPLALDAMACLLEKESEQNIHLVMAGGYDDRVIENREHYLELKERARSLGIEGHVTFKRSFSGEEKKTLLSSAECLLYTPDQEHFGIVPIEAMYMQCPVVAVRSGGPLETVVDGQTGFLCDPDAVSFCSAMEKFVSNRDLSKKFGRAGHERVISRFSFQAFTHKLNGIVMNLCA
ncbi:hypothetical protein CAPTEDRAFT_229017 [Capitella teleta]|uniref:Alpha-1,3/1,6-mannosyltransferase ALG2 n=1 Tax=Capitella teleta TaxID=283909 RepID=R7UHV4_CAPTE|nr:hypothetical protein CAPTEDRAFT_229017 [Capitella teleta]|eukprot:ELU05663.1 hypothetical protein CAPTEDRAFT_229017 [Capitella teleta]